MSVTGSIRNAGFCFAFMGAILAAPILAQDQTESAEEQAADTPKLGLEGPTVLVLLAHPDDEMLLAPALSRIARSGGDVTIMYATSGDEGPGFSGLQPGEELAKLRESEAQCSAFALRLNQPEFWQLGDGTLAEDAHLSDSTARTLITYVDEAIAKKKPRIVLTFGPDGASGHADHRMMSSAVTQVVQGMDTDRPELLYIALPSDGPTQLPGFEGWARVNPALITDRIAYESADLDAAQAAIQCYESQFDAAMRDQLIDALNQRVWRGRVHLRLAFPAPF
ncbi:PIG-L deacetylase family protein [Erythrobacter sp. YT30]|uniref:PIG-L deacetylase family protein n=1 Tax=Erythrobacter sp. YT30 TaxID=1735012 RepID=UPI00076D2A43|nr:PIG-L family deacetylase [Erythrobacter sp. YT30]KWV91596.1 hypothetical protein AUC45_10255 [Erythrobacter sp. YT30]